MFRGKGGDRQRLNESVISSKSDNEIIRRVWATEMLDTKLLVNHKGWCIGLSWEETEIMPVLWSLYKSFFSSWMS